jgi:hypothetical protein
MSLHLINLPIEVIDCIGEFTNIKDKLATATTCKTLSQEMLRGYAQCNVWSASHIHTLRLSVLQMNGNLKPCHCTLKVWCAHTKIKSIMELATNILFDFDNKEKQEYVITRMRVGALLPVEKKFGTSHTRALYLSQRRRRNHDSKSNQLSPQKNVFVWPINTCVVVVGKKRSGENSNTYQKVDLFDPNVFDDLIYIRNSPGERFPYVPRNDYRYDIPHFRGHQDSEFYIGSLGIGRSVRYIPPLPPVCNIECMAELKSLKRMIITKWDENIFHPNISLGHLDLHTLIITAYCCSKYRGEGVPSIAKLTNGLNNLNTLYIKKDYKDMKETKQLDVLVLPSLINTYLPGLCYGIKISLVNCPIRSLTIIGEIPDLTPIADTLVNLRIDTTNKIGSSLHGLHLLKTLVIKSNDESLNDILRDLTSLRSLILGNHIKDPLGTSLDNLGQLEKLIVEHRAFDPTGISSRGSLNRLPNLKEVLPSHLWH